MGNSRRADSDSGRGESGSETHSRNHLAMLGHYCNQDCLTLGHSDACWLPSNSSSKPFEVDVSDKINQSSSLYVCSGRPTTARIQRLPETTHPETETVVDSRCC